MCGIVGLVNYEERYRPEVIRRLTLAMRDTITHRGPDDAGLWLSPDGQVCLGHRRLSIVDLRPEGRQPMLNEDASVAVAFNGEIYNYRSLAERLQKQGHRFASRSDTEVLCHLFEDDPEKGIQELVGMFGLGVWRSAQRELILARDPFGKKPLYYAISQGLIAFASELRCLELIDGLCGGIDEAGVQEYLVLQYTHAPQTIYRNCRKLEPGCMVRFRLPETGKLQTDHRRYFHFLPAEPPQKEREKYREEIALETLKQHVVTAVKDRLMGDVPLGAFLSGGIDSSLVVATMVRELGVRPKTFSLGFKNSSDSEHLAARRIAQVLETDHHEILVDPSAVALLPTIAAALDEPNGDSSCLPVYLLSQFTRQHVTVALSGDGGDELFGGYRRYGDTLSEAQSPWRHVYALRHQRRFWSPARSYFQRILNMPLGWIKELTGPLLPQTEDRLQKWRDQLNSRTLPMIHRMRRFDVEVYLPGSVLAKVDRMSMQFALEVRCPLLDVRLGRWAAHLPASLCHDGQQSKKLLKRLAARYLPPEIIDLPKMGFGLPERSWAKERLLDLAHSLLLEPGSKLAPFLHRKGLKSYLEKQREHFSIYQIWTMLIMEQWLRQANRAAAPMAA